MALLFCIRITNKHTTFLKNATTRLPPVRVICNTVQNLSSPKLSKPISMFSIPTRTLHKYLPKASAATEALHKAQDDVSREYEIIYDLALRNYLTFAQIVGMIGSVCCVLIVAIMSTTDRKIDFKLLNPEFVPMKNDETLYLMFFLGLLYWLFTTVHRMPIRIYRSIEKAQYVFIKVGYFPFTTNKLGCKFKDVKYLSGDHLFWGTGKYLLKNHEKKVFLFDNSFKTPSDVNMLKGLPEDN